MNAIVLPLPLVTSVSTLERGVPPGDSALPECPLFHSLKLSRSSAPSEQGEEACEGRGAGQGT